MPQKLKFLIIKDAFQESYTNYTLELFYLEDSVNIVNHRHTIEPLKKAIEIDNLKELDKIIIPFDMICQVETDHEGDKDNYRLNATYNYANGDVTKRHNLMPL